MPKKTFPLKLGEEDRKRLEYLAKLYEIKSLAKVIRWLILIDYNRNFSK